MNALDCRRHPRGWITANGGCYACWCEREIEHWKAALQQDRNSARFALGPYTADPTVRQVLKTWGLDPEVEHQRRVDAERERETQR